MSPPRVDLIVPLEARFAILTLESRACAEFLFDTCSCRSKHVHGREHRRQNCCDMRAHGAAVYCTLLWEYEAGHHGGKRRQLPTHPRRAMPDPIGNEVACLSTFVFHMRQTRAPSELHHVGSPFKEQVKSGSRGYNVEDRVPC